VSTLRFFNHYIHARVLLQVLLLALWVVGAVYAAVHLRLGLHPQAPRMSGFLLLLQAMAFASVLLLCMFAIGAGHRPRDGGPLSVILRVVAGFILAGMCLLVLFSLLPSLHPGRGITILALLFALPGALAVQFFDYHASKKSETRWRVLFYGAGADAAELLSRLRRRSDYRFFALIGCVPVPGEDVQVKPQQLCEAKGSLSSIVRKQHIDEIVVVMDERRGNFPATELMDCRIHGIHVSDALTFYERQTGRIKTELLTPDWLIYSDGFNQSLLEDGIKRVLDLIFATILLIISAPIMLLTALAILLDDGFHGPVFFVQTRVGRDGREFRIIKFRSMRVDAEAEQTAQWAERDDPRITRAGVFIRKHRLDELPQLLNVIKGDMSLVGPRPERPEFVPQLNKTLPYYSLRHQVKPGITGWAQLKYPYGASEEDANAKLQYDLYYVKNRSTFLDFLILLGTVEVVLARKGAR